MIYIICRDRSEIKYDVPENAKIIVNTCSDNFFGEIAAWRDIYIDAKFNDYKTVGIYQARRAFHKDLKILSDDDFKDDAIYVSAKYDCHGASLYSQFVECHDRDEKLLKEVLPSSLLTIAENTGFLFPHSMFYLPFNVFEDMMKFVWSFIAPMQKFRQDDVKIFSFLTERLCTLYFVAAEKNVIETDCVCFDKNDGHIIGTKNGLP